MVDIQTISIVIASASIVVAVVYYILQIQHQKKMRLMDATFRLHSAMTSREGMEAFQALYNLKYSDYDEFVKNYGPPFSENPAQTVVLATGSFLEGLGIMVKRKLVDIDLIVDLFPVPIMWGRIKPVAEGMRKQFNEPHYLEWAEYLYDECMKHLQKRERKLQQSKA